MLTQTKTNGVFYNKQVSCNITAETRMVNSWN